MNGKLPKNLVDSNVISDYTKLTRLFDLYENNIEKNEIIEGIVRSKELSGIIKDRIGPLIKSSSHSYAENQLGFTKDDFISLLYYLGLLTISSPAGSYVNLAAPNYCISSIYSKYYLSYLYGQMNLTNVMSDDVGLAMKNVILKNELI